MSADRQSVPTRRSFSDERQKMTQEKDSKDKFSRLRKRAEESRDRNASDMENITALSPDEVQRMVHELRVHQIELEMQNEDLRQAQVKLEELKDRYLDLYDFAPVGYLTLNEKGLILEANLTAVRLLGVQRQTLIKRPFSRFVCQDFGDAYYFHLQQVFEAQSKQTCEIELTKPDGTQFYAQLDSVAVQDENGQFSRCRTIVIDISERKRAEGKQRESEERYRDLVENIQDLICTHDLQGNLLFVNQASATVVGYSPAELVGTDMRNFLAPEGRDQFDAYLAAIQRDGQASGLMLVQTKSGEKRIWEYRNTLRTEGSGEPIVRGLAHDITERKKMEEGLREAEQRYRRLFERAPSMYVVTRSERGVPFISDCNQLFLTSIGYTREEVQGKPLADFYSPESRTEMLEHDGYARALAGEFFIGERQLLRSDGGLIPTLLYTAPEANSSGQVIGTRAMFVDITKLKQAEQGLHESQRKYQELVDNANSAIIRWSRDGTIKFCNEFAQTFFGYTADEVIDRHVNILVPEKDSTGRDLSTLVQDIVNHPDRYVNTVNENICRDGRRVWMTWTNKPILDDKGQVVQILAVGSDITDQKRFEVALRESEKRFKSMFQLHDAVMLLIEPETGQIVDANLSAQRFYGYQVPGLLGMSIQQINALTPDEIVRERQKALSRERNHFIFPHRLANGEVRTVEVHSSPIDYEGQRILFSIVYDITDRKKAEEALKESEQRYRAVIDNVEIGISLLNSKMEIVAVNNAMKKYFPHVRPGCGQICYEQYNDPPNPEPCSYCPCVLTLQDGEAHEAITETPLGQEIRYYHLVSSPVKDSDGRVQYVIELTQDITDRKISEALLLVRMNLLEYASTHSLDELLQKTLDEIGTLTNSPIGFYHFISEDEKTIYLQMWSSRTMQEFCKAEGKGQHYKVDQGGVWVDAVRERRPVIHNDYSTLSHRKGLPEGHAPLIRELVVPIMRSDRIVAILGIGNKPTDYSEKDIEVVSYLADVAWEIATRKRAEEALKESAIQYRTLFEESIDGVYSVLRDGTMTDANQSFCELFGYTKEGMIGKDIRELYLDPADRPRFQKEIERKGFVKEYEVRWRKRDGTEVDCVLTSSVHFAKDGSIVGYRGIVRDMTERKTLRGQLFQAQKMEAVGTLAGGIAHDFNNILQVVLGYSELVLADEVLPDGLKNDLGKVILAARNGADLVQRLLTFSRKAETKPLNLDLNKRIRQTQKFLERTIPKMIQIELVLSDDLNRIHADPIQIDQILMNLAVNARDAMAEGGRLVIETTNVFLGGCRTGNWNHPEFPPGFFQKTVSVDPFVSVER